MPTDPTASPRSAVAPLLDYEPPARPAMPNRSAHPPAPAPSARPRPGHPPRTRPGRPAHKALPATLRSAAVFADAALRRVLEVVDGRRPSTHLHPLLATGLADSVASARPAPPAGRLEPATLQRVRVQPAGAGEPASAVEVFGTYRRGRRTHALACRVEPIPRTGNGTVWRIVALHIG
ncbi:Rv3235 family protein [Mycobacterium sp. UM_WGJ]|uniref:Rv3235 family protein n=1 Tax=Mycobacterium sp. UM_WGJ TaxID=1370120 RepID=UPI000465534D|nr:Rv3235 family protein [Mycobacterium sp. UM_WGJ]